MNTIDRNLRYLRHERDLYKKNLSQSTELALIKYILNPVSSVGEKAGNALKEMIDGSKKMACGASDRLHQDPWKSIAVVAGASFLLGMLKRK